MEQGAKQAPNADECAGMLLDTIPQLMRMLGALHRQVPGEEELPNFGQIRMLAILQARPWTLGDLASRHHVAASTMSRSIDLLVKRGWVERRAAPHDRRQVLLALTEQGMAVHNAMALQSRALVAELIGRLEAGEQLQLYGGLVALNRLFSHTNPCRTEQEQN